MLYVTKCRTSKDAAPLYIGGSKDAVLRILEEGYYRVDIHVREKDMGSDHHAGLLVYSCTCPADNHYATDYMGMLEAAMGKNDPDVKSKVAGLKAGKQREDGTVVQAYMYNSAGERTLMLCKQESISRIGISDGSEMMKLPHAIYRTESC